MRTQSSYAQQTYATPPSRLRGNRSTLALLMAQQDRERGERIAELRKACGYTSADKLAGALDVNYRSVQNWEAGKGISEDNVKDLAELLQVTREFILYGPPETPDLTAAFNGSGDLKVQLDRIERKVDELLRRQVASDDSAETDEATRPPTPLRRRRNVPAPRGPRKKAGGS